MKIYKQGHYKNVTEKQYEQQYKKLGYEVVEVVESLKVVEEPQEEMTKKDIMALLDEQGTDYDKRAKKADLFELLEGEE